MLLLVGTLERSWYTEVVSSSSYDMYPPPHMTCREHLGAVLVHRSDQHESAPQRLWSGFMFIMRWWYTEAHVRCVVHDALVQTPKRTHTPEIGQHTHTHTHTHTHGHTQQEFQQVSGMQ
jgi:hypothetical protein